GEKALPRTQVIKKIWDYIKKHNLQNPKNKRNILADDKLKPVIKGKSEVTMF
ncbi:MAG: SWIB/MDM2 domain-containing protein, partial [Bdellovibrionota bacterium]|nr:SWIB/MDM2 domain-containing protein [Bdellovibrionota bacterium]